MYIEELSFEVRAIVGKVEVSMATYLGLQIGDILLLNQKTEDPLLVEAGEAGCFRGRPGLSETRKAIKIDERIHP